jgi:hypothetical protein
VHDGVLDPGRNFRQAERRADGDIGGVSAARPISTQPIRGTL